MKSFNKPQQGFTLLELLVVITLLAVLSVGALVAYDNVGTKAESAAAANNNVTIDRAIRQYTATTGKYPNQWDSLVTPAGDAIPTLADGIESKLASLTFANVGNASLSQAILSSLGRAGIGELQYFITNTSNAEPNRAHNESINPGDGSTTGAVEIEFFDDGVYDGGDAASVSLAIVPSGQNSGDPGDGGTAACTIGTHSLNKAAFDGTAAPALNTVQNTYNDILEQDECHLVVALGFGSDAAASTTTSNVAISQSPTYTKLNAVNPSQNYARFIGLFLIGSDDDEDGAITQEDIDNKARLIAMIAPDGTTIDQALAASAPDAD